VDRAPQIDRLLARIRGSAAPVIQLWGWPGSGRAELLAALLDDEGEAARGLAPEDVGVDAVRSAVAAGCRWIVAPALPRGVDAGERIAELAEAVPSGAHLVFATRRPVPAPGPLAALLAPEDLALTPEEVAELARAAGAPVPSPARARRVVEAADGWYRPLRLAAEAAAADGEDLPDSAGELVTGPAVARFLRDSVLADLSPEERRRLVDSGGDGPRAPRLLRALLKAEAGDGETLAPATGPPEIPEGVRFRLHLLGRPEAWRRDRGGDWRRLHWPLKRAFRALAYLASEAERRAAREDLVEALWGDEPAGAVSRNFHPTLSHLRRGLRQGAPEEDDLDPLLLVDGVYELDPELGWWTDLDALARLEETAAEHSARGRDEEAIATWEAAWRLYRGHFLEGSYEPWVLTRREEHQRRYLRLLQSLADARLRLGRLQEAVDAYRAVLVEDPLQESAHAALMRLYARRDRRDLVRRQYERLTVLLRDELGVEPLPETTREFHRLMTERAVRRAGVPAAGDEESPG
jgi:DNA-binding SARP family transcriptional activator